MVRWWLGLTLACLSATAAAQALHVGFGTHKPPYVFEGEPRGLEYESVTRAAANAGFELTAYYAPMERLHLMLRRGEIDAITTTHDGALDCLIIIRSTCATCAGLQACQTPGSISTTLPAAMGWAPTACWNRALPASTMPSEYSACVCSR